MIGFRLLQGHWQLPYKQAGREGARALCVLDHSKSPGGAIEGKMQEFEASHCSAEKRGMPTGKDSGLRTVDWVD